MGSWKTREYLNLKEDDVFNCKWISETAKKQAQDIWAADRRDGRSSQRRKANLSKIKRGWALCDENPRGWSFEARGCKKYLGAAFRPKSSELDEVGNELTNQRW